MCLYRIHRWSLTKFSVYTNTLLATLNARQLLFRGTVSEARSTDNMSVVLQELHKGSQVIDIPFSIPFLMLPRDLTLLPTFQQQNISIKIDTTTQEYHSGNQKLHDGSIEVSICHLCHFATPGF